MVKADRYTQDGCKQLQKAKEAIAEDKRYQIGEISQETGLQKTANGWVEPQKGKAEGAKAKIKPAAPKAPKPSMQQYMKAKQDIKQFEDTFKKQNEQYEARQRMGAGASAMSPLWGLKPNDYKNDPQYKKAAEVVQAFEANDSAPRQLTGDCKIRIRKEN